MISLFIFLQWHSFVNRLVERIKRLKRPKYLVGAIFGLAYFYFYFGRFFFRPGSARGVGGFSMAWMQDLEIYGSVAVFVLLILSWIFPGHQKQFLFSEAEAQFLFPAPLTRSQLVNFKLLSSQLKIIFTIILLSLLTRRQGQSFIFRAMAWWLFLFCTSLHGMGASFSMHRLKERGCKIMRLQAALGGLLILTAASFGIYSWQTKLAGAFPLISWFKRMLSLLGQEPVATLLTPFRAIIHPYFTFTKHDFILAALPTACIVVIHYYWVARTVVSFEEGALEQARERSKMTANRLAGRLPRTSQTAVDPLFPLAPSGHPLAAVLWKNWISFQSDFSVKFWLTFGAMVLFASLWLSRLEVAAPACSPIAIFMLVLIGISFLLGPAMLRYDFRQDFSFIDSIKLWPFRGWQLVLAEIAVPVGILASVQFFMAVIAFIFGSQLPQWGDRFSLGLIILVCLLVIIPLTNGFLFILPNCLVLYLPSWFSSSSDQNPQAMENMGQRIFSLVAQVLLLLAVLLLPGGFLAGVTVLFQALGYLKMGLAFGVLGFVGIAVVELWLLLRLAGRVLDQLDISAESKG